MTAERSKMKAVAVHQSGPLLALGKPRIDRSAANRRASLGRSNSNSTISTSLEIDLGICIAGIGKSVKANRRSGAICSANRAESPAADQS